MTPEADPNFNWFGIFVPKSLVYGFIRVFLVLLVLAGIRSLGKLAWNRVFRKKPVAQGSKFTSGNDDAK